MKAIVITLVLAAVTTAAAPLSAQNRGSNSGPGRGECRFERVVDAAGNIVFLRAVGERGRRCQFRNRDENVLFENALDAQGNRVFVRRVRDANGRLVIQRVRRNPDGTLTVISSRIVARERDDDDREFDRRGRDDDRRGRRGRDRDDDHGGRGRH